MKNTKKLQVLLMPTKEALADFSQERVYPCILKHSWMFDKDELGKLVYADSNLRTPTQLQHIYEVSDDKISPGDWFITSGGNSYRCLDVNSLVIYFYRGSDRCAHSTILAGCKKLHSSTNNIINNGKIQSERLPLTDTQVIEDFIKDYNNNQEVDQHEYRYEIISKGADGFPEDDVSWWVKKPNQNTPKEIDFIKGFLNQFAEGHELQELSDKEWTVTSFLLWLEANNFKITKK